MGQVPVNPSLGHQQETIWMIERYSHGVIKLASRPGDYLMTIKYDAYPAEFEPPFK